MDNVVKLRHRHDLDMMERIRRKTYSFLLSNVDRHTDRIRAIVSKVETEDGSAAHLDFCFTDYHPYGRNYLCATWPRYPDKVLFHPAKPIDYEHLFRGYTDSGDGDPLQIGRYWGRDFQHHVFYLFFNEDPHKPHRPYFFSGFNPLFDNSNQDPQKIISYHAPEIIKEWQTKRGIVDKVADSDLSVESLVVLERWVKLFHLE